MGPPSLLPGSLPRTPPSAPEWGVLLGQGQEVSDVDGPVFQLLLLLLFFLSAQGAGQAPGPPGPDALGIQLPPGGGWHGGLRAPPAIGRGAKAVGEHAVLGRIKQLVPGAQQAPALGGEGAVRVRGLEPAPTPGP